MTELKSVGALNALWFTIAHISVPLILIQHIYKTSISYIPCSLNNFWIYLLISFICINIIILLLYKGFLYQTTVRSTCLGLISAAGIYLSSQNSGLWSAVGWYLCILSAFHFSEFAAIAYCNPNSLSVSSFILNHSLEYWIALAASWIEFIIECYFWASLKDYKIISWFGVGLCLFGEVLRKTAMVTASTNFNHVVQSEKEKDHRLVTHGVYAWCRHPSYLGWFLWSIGTQLLLLNPVCTLVYTIVSWNFFRGRIIMEEWYLLNFFKEEYVDYQKRVGTGLPFITGLIVGDPRKES